MAIEPMKKVTLVADAEEASRLSEWLYARRVLHLCEPVAGSCEVPPPLERMPSDPRHAEAEIAKLGQILSLCRISSRAKKPFLDDLFAPRIVLTRDQLEETLKRLDVEQLHKDAEEYRARFTEVSRSIQNLREEIKALEPFSFLRESPARLKSLRAIPFRIFEGPLKGFERLRDEASALEWIAVEILAAEKGRSVLGAVWAIGESHRAIELFERFGFSEMSLPDLERLPQEEIELLQERLSELEIEERKVREEIASFAARYEQDATVALGYWESERLKAENVRRILKSARMSIARGYLRRRDLEPFHADLRAAFPEAILIAEDPDPADDVPVSLKTNAFFRPVQLLVNMFGLPSYFSFDPTAYLTISFLVFFGICIGDVGYGAMLVVISLLLRNRYRNQPGLSNFFTLFAYAGVSTAIFGALTGSWFANLYEPTLLGEGNILARLRQRLVVLEPLSKPTVALLVAIAIGVMNQFYAIILRMYGSFRRRLWKEGVYDGVLWLVFLSGLVVLAPAVFTTLPAGLLRLGWGLVAIGAAGLMLTQGRKEETIPAKIIVGIISLYGIMGTYGATGFIADVLSYSRLLALGLTTSVVGMSFNLIGGIVKGMPVVGIGFLAVVLIFGHSFNLVMSLITAFVHSVRLIFLEFFGRFYSAGATRFRPFGFQSETIELADAA